jgi:hypothetical protein
MNHTIEELQQHLADHVKSNGLEGIRVVLGIPDRPFFGNGSGVLIPIRNIGEVPRDRLDGE